MKYLGGDSGSTVQSVLATLNPADIASIAAGNMTPSAGPKLVEWSLLQPGLLPGVYFMKLTIGQQSGTQKVIIYQ